MSIFIFEVAKRKRHCHLCYNEIVEGEACQTIGGAYGFFKRNICENCLRGFSNQVEDYNAEHLPYHEDEPCTQ